MLTRRQDTSKWDYGHALLIAGRYGCCGCAVLAARAALRSGCGLLTVHLPERCVDVMQVAFPEAMVDVDSEANIFSTLPSDISRYTAVAVGPGIGRDVRTQEAVCRLVEQCTSVPLILDADALNVISVEVLLKRRRDALPIVLTPHKYEYRRLFADADPAEMAERYNVVIVKKAHRTEIFAPGRLVATNTTGNAAMATAGVGDVLTGMLLGSMAQLKMADIADGLRIGIMHDIVCNIVQKHGGIADLLVKNQSESSVIASDMVEKLREVNVCI